MLINRGDYNFCGDRKQRTGPGPDGDARSSPFCCACPASASFLTEKKWRTLWRSAGSGAGPFYLLNYAWPQFRTRFRMMQTKRTTTHIEQGTRRPTCLGSPNQHILSDCNLRETGVSAPKQMPSQNPLSESRDLT
jgi:hypothetical protein